MSYKNKNETESILIEEIIPSKNNDRSINQDDNNSKSIIENYDEQKSAQSVIGSLEESK